MLVDAGPLVALLDVRDAQHERCVTTMASITGPLVTVWPALTEAMYLLGPTWRGPKALLSRLETGDLQLAGLDTTDAGRIRVLMDKYQDLPMDLADAALVHVAERDGHRRIFTLDRRHFSVYRRAVHQPFTIVP